jgi:DNA-binding MltR family transcriptional regulator
MAKSLFKNYSFEFDKNEKKILLGFCKTILKQMSADEKFYADVRAFSSIVEKLNSNETETKFTKEEKTKLAFRLKENVDHMSKQIKNSGFFKRWLYKSAYKQYKVLLDNYFSN